MLLWTLPAGATTRYVSQSGGLFTGGTSCNGQTAISVVTFNGLALAGDDQTWLCGTLTTSVAPANGGTSGHPIVLQFDTGASITKSNCGTLGCINLNGLSNVLIDGSQSSTACGYIGGNDVPCNSVIVATGNGSGSGNADSDGVYARGGGSNIEIRNFACVNMYVHSSTTDTNAMGNYNCVWTDATNIHVHHCVLHDAFAGIKGEAGNNTSEYNNCQIYNDNWGVALSGPGGATPVINSVKIHDNDFHDYKLWDTTTNAYHHDGILVAGNNNNANAVTNIAVYNNRLHGTISDGPTCAVASNSCMTALIFMNDGNHFSVYNNVLVPDVGGGLVNNGWIFLWSPGTLNANDTIVDNTVIGNQVTSGACIVVEGDASMTWQNNVSSNCNLLARVYTSPATSFTQFTNNTYQNASLSNSWQLGATTYSTLGAWQAALVAASLPGDTSSQAQTTSLLLNSQQIPQPSSSVISFGTNLTTSCSGLLSALCSDALGNARPGGVTAWDSGALNKATAATFVAPAYFITKLKEEESWHTNQIHQVQ